MSQMFWLGGIKMRAGPAGAVAASHTTRLGLARSRKHPWLGRLTIAAALTVACATCGRNDSLASAQPLPATTPVVAAPGAPPNEPVSEAALADARAQLAEKFLEAAEQILHNGIPGEHQWQQGAALLQAACTLNPSEPSYPRLLAEAWRQLGDNDRVIAALNLYRAAAKHANWPDDQVAQVELIDRYLINMQSDDERLKYLREMLALPALALEVKAHAAVQAVPLLAQRSVKEAQDMIQQAIRLDPLNLPARRLQYQEVEFTGSPLERIEVLLAMLLSNPAQRDVLEELAGQLSEAGLADASLDWYRTELQVSNRSGVPLENRVLLDFATQSYAAGQYAEADILVNQVIEASPRNPDAWFMRLAFDRANPDRYAAYQQEMEIAKRVFVTQAANVAKKILGPVRLPGAGGEAPPAPGKPSTQPAAQPEAAGPQLAITGIDNKELRSVIDRIQKGEAPEGTDRLFISAVAYIAWFHLYFENAPDEAVQWVTVLKAVVPENDPLAVRLQGWLDLTAGRYAQAQAELLTIQGQDPLAALGIVRMASQGLMPGAQPAPAGAAPATGPGQAPATRPAAGTQPAAAAAASPRAAAAANPPATAPALPPHPQKPGDEAKNFEKADVLGKQLLARTRRGVPAALVWAFFHDRKLQPDPRADAAAIRAELGNFPAQWIHVIDRPEQFYLVICTPVKMPHKLGEPMLASVSLQNIGKFDITVGPGGVVSPDLFFDAWLGVSGNRPFPNAVYDRVANVLVLPAKTISKQVVRIDQGPIAEALRDKPASDVSMYARVTTNPTARGTAIVPGPAGIRRDFKQQFVRKSSAMADNVQKQQVMAGMKGLPSERMLTLEALQAHVLAARKPDANGPTLALAPELSDEINKARADAVPDVAAWATYLAMSLVKPEEKLKVVASLASSHEWEVRLLAGVAAMELPPDQRDPIAQQLARDTMPDITLFGAALAQDIARPTSRPAMEDKRVNAAAPAKGGAGGSPATAPVGPALP